MHLEDRQEFWWSDEGYAMGSNGIRNYALLDDGRIVQYYISCRPGWGRTGIGWQDKQFLGEGTYHHSEPIQRR